MSLGGHFLECHVKVNFSDKNWTGGTLGAAAAAGLAVDIFDRFDK